MFSASFLYFSLIVVIFVVRSEASFVTYTSRVPALSIIFITAFAITSYPPTANSIPWSTIGNLPFVSSPTVSQGQPFLPLTSSLNPLLQWNDDIQVVAVVVNVASRIIAVWVSSYASFPITRTSSARLCIDQLTRSTTLVDSLSPMLT